MVITAAVRNLFRRSIAKETIRICGDAASATVERSIEVLKCEFHPGSATEFHERAARPRGSAQALVQCPAAGGSVTGAEWTVCAHLSVLEVKAGMPASGKTNRTEN